MIVDRYMPFSALSFNREGSRRYETAATFDGGAAGADTTSVALVWFKGSTIRSSRNEYIVDAYSAAGGHRWELDQGDDRLRFVANLSGGVYVPNVISPIETQHERRLLVLTATVTAGGVARVYVNGTKMDEDPAAGTVQQSNEALVLMSSDSGSNATLTVALLGFLYSENFALAEASVPGYYDSVVDALRHGRAIPHPRGEANVVVGEDYRWDSRDVIQGGAAIPTWTDQISSLDLDRTGATGTFEGWGLRPAP